MRSALDTLGTAVCVQSKMGKICSRAETCPYTSVRGSPGSCAEGRQEGGKEGRRGSPQQRGEEEMWWLLLTDGG